MFVVCQIVVCHSLSPLAALAPPLHSLASLSLATRSTYRLYLTPFAIGLSFYSDS
jgi:hypothetical protein